MQLRGSSIWYLIKVDQDGSKWKLMQLITLQIWREEMRQVYLGEAITPEELDIKWLEGYDICLAWIVGTGCCANKVGFIMIDCDITRFIHPHKYMSFHSSSTNSPIFCRSFACFFTINQENLTEICGRSGPCTWGCRASCSARGPLIYSLEPALGKGWPSWGRIID